MIKESIRAIPEMIVPYPMTANQMFLTWWFKVKVSGPCIETSCVFFCIKNVINAEMWA